MCQEELFAIEEFALARPEISGFRLEANYISLDEERELLSHIDAEPWQTDYRRHVQVYGLGYASGRGQAPTWLRDFPQWLMPLAERVARDAPLERFPENCVINEYIPPQGIGRHKDYSDFGPAVACVSLGSEIVLEFTEPERKLHVPVVVPARSLWVIRGDARWKWEHGISPRLNDIVAGQRRRRGRRVSVTFRTANLAGVHRPGSAHGVYPRTIPEKSPG